MKNIKEIILLIYFIIRLPILLILRGIIWPRKKSFDPKIKILIIRLDRMGDFVLSLPFIDNLRLAYPDARIDILVRPFLKDLAESTECITNTICYKGFLTTIGMLMKRRYDVAVDMLYDYKIKSALIALLTRAPIKVGFAWGFREVFFTGSVEAQNDKHMVDLNLELLKLLRIPDKVHEPKIRVGEAEKPAEKVIVIHPGGHYKSQRWSPKKFALLGSKILQVHNAKLNIIAGPGEKRMAEYIAKSINDPRAIVSYPSVKELISILKGSQLIICNNSGPLHLAAALSVPSVSTMGPTDPVLWWPCGANHTVIKAVKGIVDNISVDRMYGEVCRELDRLNISKH